MNPCAHTLCVSIYTSVSDDKLRMGWAVAGGFFFNSTSVSLAAGGSRNPLLNCKSCQASKTGRRFYDMRKNWS